MGLEELKKRLIDSIQKTDNENPLEEVFRLLQLESEHMEIPYKVDQDFIAIVRLHHSVRQFKSV